jgi:hypothetical protein
MSTAAPSPAAPPAPRRPATPRRRPPSPLPVITASLGLFLVVLTLLALQVRSGKDPSLSARTAGNSASGTSTSAPRSTAPRIVTRSS